ncbi:MAG TPA: hypothetical protein VFL90_13415 [Methylomirabilota bacterium]|nr:hypothetical protein [Methylomirabilota bacterium]
MHVRQLPLAAVVLLSLASIVLTVVSQARQPLLLVATATGTAGVALLGVEFLRQPRLRAVGWIVLALALATFIVLAQTAWRLLAV